MINIMKDENIDEFIDSLCLKYKHTPGDLFFCAKAHYDEIHTMERIFKYETEEDIRRCMVVSRLLKPEWADLIIEYSRREKFKKDKFNQIAEPDISKYSLLLITAFFHNAYFYKTSQNWCVFSYIDAKEQIRVNKPPVEPHWPSSP
jgi:hypothetical protein